ncbi:MAG: hypothetical protein EP343_05780 [Deltaproteobacteria bacterium]|nr:MAG: hypothetical protein EP343_05780 [Deltaproteobacteria bacterium]
MQHLDCPNCARPVEWDGNTFASSQVLRCSFCNHRFSPQDPQASLAPAAEETAPAEEVWELDVDGEDPFGSPESLLDDFDFMDESNDDMDGATRPDYEAPSLEEIMGVPADSQVPDLPDLPDPVSSIIKMSGSNMSNSNWGDLLDDVDENTPALPPMDFELKEADPNSFVPQQSEQVGQTKRPKFDPRPAPSSPPPAEPPVLFASKPPPGAMSSEPKNESLSDLLESFVEEEEKEVEETRYYVQRNEKDFGPFSEAEVLGLIEARKLKGDELIRESDSNEWTRLEDSPDFRATIEVLRKVPVRTGWERQRRATPPHPSAIELEQMEAAISEPPLDEVGSPTGGSILRGGTQEAQATQEQPAKPSKRNLILASIVGGLALLLGVIWYTSGPSPTKKKPKTKQLSLRKLVITDSFPMYKTVLQKTMRSYQKGKFSLAWYNIRFAYHLLDSYGDDRSIRGGAEQVYRKLMARKKNKTMMVRISLLRAASLNQSQEVAKLLPIAKLPPEHAEWGYVTARAQELTGQFEKAKETYSKLLKRHRDHVRAILGLYRVYKALNKPYQASSYLLRAFRTAPNHLPSQLAALRYAVQQGTWLTFRPKIRQNVQRIIRNNHYTQGGLAQWYVLQANKHWQLRQTDKAIYRVEQAITLSPQIRAHQRRRIQFLLWSNKPYQARQAIKAIPHWKKQPQLVIWDFQALLRNSTQNKIVKYLEPMSEEAAKSPRAKYLYYYLLALSYLHQNEASSAISSCLSATQVKGAKMPKPFAHLMLLQLYNKAKSWDKMEGQLKELEQIGYTSPNTEYYAGLLALNKNELEKAKSLAQQMRKRNPTQYQSHLLAAHVAKKEKRIGRTIRLYRKALLYHPQRPSPLLLQMGNFLLQHNKLQQAYTLYIRYEKLLGSDTMPCRVLRQKFQAMVGLKRCKELLAISIKHCKHFSLHMFRGQCSEQLKKPDAAEEEYQKARRLVPNTLDPIEALAALHYKQNKFKKAKEFYTKLQEKAPDKALYLTRLLKLLRREQLNRKAIRLLRKNIRKFEKDFPLQVEAVYVYTTQRRQLWRARRLLKKLKDEYTSTQQVIQLHYAQANLYTQIGKTKKAIQEYSDIIKKDGKEAEAYYQRGKLFFKRRKYRSCFDDTSTLLKLEPNHPDEDAIKLWRDTCKRKM